MKRPAFLTPIADAEAVGLVPYWLGPEFLVGDKTFIIDGQADFGSARVGGPTIGFGYSAPQGGLLRLQTLARDANLVETFREQVQSIAGGESFDVSVGSLPGTFFTLPAAGRPVNTMVLFIETDGGVIRAVVNAADSGVPGEDSNPLLNRDTLIATLGMLRPYPE